jgi:hypothetical protein
MPDRDGNGGQSFSDVAYPVVSGKNGEGLADLSQLGPSELVKCFGIN